MKLLVLLGLISFSTFADDKIRRNDIVTIEGFVFTRLDIFNSCDKETRFKATSYHYGDNTYTLESTNKDISCSIDVNPKYIKKVN